MSDGLSVDNLMALDASQVPTQVYNTFVAQLQASPSVHGTFYRMYGLERACERHKAIRDGVNTYNGYVTHSGVAESQGRQWQDLARVE